MEGSPERYTNEQTESKGDNNGSKDMKKVRFGDKGVKESDKEEDKN